VVVAGIRIDHRPSTRRIRSRRSLPLGLNTPAGSRSPQRHSGSVRPDWPHVQIGRSNHRPAPRVPQGLGAADTHGPWRWAANIGRRGDCTRPRPAFAPSSPPNCGRQGQHGQDAPIRTPADDGPGGRRNLRNETVTRDVLTDLLTTRRARLCPRPYTGGRWPRLDRANPGSRTSMAWKRAGFESSKLHHGLTQTPGRQSRMEDAGSRMPQHPIMDHLATSCIEHRKQHVRPRGAALPARRPLAKASSLA
jgi:hypothetical protein